MQIFVYDAYPGGIGLAEQVKKEKSSVSWFLAHDSLTIFTYPEMVPLILVLATSSCKQ